MKIFFSLLVIFFSLTVNSRGEKIPYDEILVIINDRIITKNELELTLVRIIQENQLKVTSEREIESLRSDTLKNLVDEKLLDIRADELTITILDDELDEEIDNFQKDRNLTPATFEELLQSQNFSAFSFRKLIHDKMRRDKVILREVRSGIQVSDDELKKLYEQAEEKTSVHGRHILRILPPNNTQAEEEKAREEIVWIREKIKSGSSFEAMADQYSQDPSVKMNHGDLGFFKKTDMVKEFSETAFTLEEYVLSQPVRTKFGYHLIEVLEKKILPKAPFEKVKRKLYSQYYQETFLLKLSEYLNSLREKTKIIFVSKKHSQTTG